MSENQESVPESVSQPSNPLIPALNHCNSVVGKGLIGLIGKIVSAIIVLISLLIVVVSGCKSLTYSGDRVVVPTYEKFKQMHDGSLDDEVTDEQLHIVEKEYGDDIIEMLKPFNLATGDDKALRDTYQKYMAVLHEDLRKPFLKGLIKFTETASEEYLENNKDQKDVKLSPEQWKVFSNQYQLAWDKAVEESKNTQSEIYIKHQSEYYWSVCREALMLLMFALAVGFLASISCKLRK